ncbi:MAG: DEAD/DEAH box helicase [Candidatus Thermoplasmatota archaeon]|nr:DEAD/DEAH box helicase [Euryarchaeota archaeon]MBU4032596.1 DEAD/DEAH box helicase [Candidatus Thermoplasmatota archaeon]MBU4070657.1 DEAD/DEAH box helicase [Candidatus Thermoplasmatota archaeon]MBU4145099.1 DEAD/DEAH box helicase [Candidatus Thermoplasmatota archaeon]MBU4592232.1 DEAD/DEAH box helicase [Candidatus Thermoplasmatota archaeon]
MKFHGLDLDDFQIEACEHITNGDSVVVSASTGTGKTLIAEYAIEFYAAHRQRAVYTSPIKALSNQKYMDFVAQFGKENVGILTGDVSINKEARILVMTTEVYRNMALADPKSIEDVGTLILDEVHFMNDPERGTVWEESIIFSPPKVRFLALSATIPNAREFASWINSIHGHDVKVVEYEKRAVPLFHHFYFGANNIITREDLPHAIGQMARENPHSGNRGKNRRGKKAPKPKGRPPNFLDLVKYMEQNDQLPCLFFNFSRKDCESKALETAYNMNFFKNHPEPEMDKIIETHLSDPEIFEMDSIQSLIQVLERGVAFHHAGMLPAAKRAVEDAFGKNLISVLYATETFAVGINYPARTVAFSSLRKYDGTRHRYVNSKEYFQMAGRAGRRGMDSKGVVIAMVDRGMDDLSEIQKFTKADRIPIFSQFQLSYNTVLNLIDKHSEAEIEIVLEKSFDSFLKKNAGQRVNVWASWNNRVRTLRKLGHLQANELTPKGHFTTKIFTEELVTAEVFADVKWKRWTPLEMACLAAAITYEPRHFRNQRPKRGNTFYRIMSSLEGNPFLMRNLSIFGLSARIPLVEAWCRGESFSQLVIDFGLPEGDIIRIFRQTIDVLEQVRRATDQELLKQKASEAMRLLDKDVVSVTF